MKAADFIKRILSIFLLGVFAIGITPKQVLHDLLTNHVHTPTKESAATSVSKDRFSCDEENLVAESPFVEHYFNINIPPLTYFPGNSGIRISSYSFLHPFFFELRGPPSLA